MKVALYQTSTGRLAIVRPARLLGNETDEDAVDRIMSLHHPNTYYRIVDETSLSIDSKIRDGYRYDPVNNTRIDLSEAKSIKKREIKKEAERRIFNLTSGPDLTAKQAKQRNLTAEALRIERKERLYLQNPVLNPDSTPTEKATLAAIESFFENQVAPIRSFSDQLEGDVDANDDIHMDVKNKNWPS